MTFATNNYKHFNANVSNKFRCISNMSIFLKHYAQPLQLDPRLPSSFNIDCIGKPTFFIIFMLCTPLKLIIFLLFLDAVLHHTWNHRTETCSITEYQQLVENVKFTPRMWNSNVTLNKVLKHISWTLNLDINVIGVKRIDKRSENFRGQCPHQNNTQCVNPYYRFQNSFVKLLFPKSKHFSQINLLYYKKKYYILTNVQHLNPFLINQLPIQNITFNNKVITNTEVMELLLNNKVELPFSVVIFTTYNYVHQNWTKQIKNNCMGFSQNKDSLDIIYLFLEPSLNSKTFTLSILNSITDTVEQFNKKNIFSNAHITEGKPLKIGSRSKNQELLNQEHCVCDHDATKIFFAPGEQKFKPIGT
jgi:hypothetical protein